MTNIRTQSPPLLISQPKASFNNEAFDATVFQQGYRVQHEEARQCPCVTRESGSPLSTCQNCRGYGWTFLNPIITKAVISNINKKTKYGIEWSEESVGTIMVSLMNINKLAEYDRITFIDVVSKRSETMKVRNVNGQMFVFLTYKPVDIIDVFYLQDPLLPLVKLLTGQDYSISENNEYVLLLDFAPPSNFNGTITVTYTCMPQYLVLDLPHDLRASSIINSSGQLEKIDLPVNAVLRKSHIVLGVSDYDGGILTLDNSYK
jgi:hypothetical protein